MKLYQNLAQRNGLCAIILISIMLVFALHTSAQKTSKYAGTYNFKGDDSLSGYLIVYPETDSTMLFYIHRAATKPIYETWGNYGRMHMNLNTNIGVYYRGDKSLGMQCMLIFQFLNGRVFVPRDKAHDKCLYSPRNSENVMAYGEYDISDSNKVNYFIYSKKDTIYFNGKSLKSWEAY